MSQVARALVAAARALAGPPLIDFTRIVRITLNVRVLPSVLCTTPSSIPRAFTLPLFLLNSVGMNLPVTVRPLPVVPTMRELSWPSPECATDRAVGAAACGADAALPAVKASATVQPADKDR